MGRCTGPSTPETAAVDMDIFTIAAIVIAVVLIITIIIMGEWRR